MPTRETKDKSSCTLEESRQDILLVSEEEWVAVLEEVSVVVLEQEEQGLDLGRVLVLLDS
jgi:hypothetical protein